MALKKPFERLSRNIIPKNYNLELKPDLKLFSFEGIVSIHVVIATSTKKIILNCLDLSIKTVSFSTSNAKRLQPIDTAISVHDQTATFIFIDDLPIGEGTLIIEFKGTLNDKLQGFYRSKYVATNGEERYSAVTQFQVAQARRAFPCWDEPEFKATFNISLNIPEDRIAISNMSILSEMADGTGNKTVKFNTTPVMSTYIVAFIVGEYDFVEDKSKDGVTVRVYTPLGKKEQGLFALAVATKVLPYYKDYFNIAYPLPKLDLIALADLSLSAMENWGLVTYREKCLLVDPQNSSAFSKQWTALTIGHELAHMWFGNLVTMEWWTDLWLNEGYATFIEFLCVNHVFPEYDIWTQFVTDTFIRALELDRLNNSHQIEIPVGHPSEIDEIFDDISYQKGASIIRMLHDYIGEEDFRKGLNLYLTRHQYKNTSTVDLWAALAEASQKPIGAIMSTWTKQVGFPIIQVFSKQQGTGRVLTLNQDKYTADGSKGSDDSLWMVPITISVQGQPNKPLKSLVLEKKTQEIEIENISPESWIKLNPGTVGYYRTLYPTEMLNQLVSAVRDATLPPLDRLGLLDDSFAMVQAGHTSSVEFLNLLEAYTEETNYTVWSSISNRLSQFISVFSHIELHKSLNDFARKLFSKIHKRLGWEAKADENHLDILLRSLVIGRMIAFEDPGAIIEAKERFELHVLGTKLLPADLRTPCYEAALTGSDSDETREEVFTRLLDLYRTEQLQEEKLRISRALASVKSPKLLRRVLEFSISNDVRYHDSTLIIAAVAFNVHGRDMAWDFFKDNWRIFIDRYQGGFLLFRLIKSVAQNLLPEGKARDVEDFFNTHPTPGAERTIQQCLEMISLNVAWLSRDQDSVKVYLKNYQ